jgi:hypothetical protein
MTNCTHKVLQLQHISDICLDSPDSNQAAIISNDSTDLDKWLEDSDTIVIDDNTDIPASPRQTERQRAQSIQSHFFNLTIRGFNHGDVRLEATKNIVRSPSHLI